MSLTFDLGSFSTWWKHNVRMSAQVVYGVGVEALGVAARDFVRHCERFARNTPKIDRAPLEITGPERKTCTALQQEPRAPRQDTNQYLFSLTQEPQRADS